MKIFLSSTAYDLHDFRALVVDRLQRKGHEVLYHESPTFPARLGHHSHDQCLLAIKECDLVLCIVDKRYGGTYHGNFPFDDQVFRVTGKGQKKYEVIIPAKGLSITWCEVITAYNENKHVITFTRQRTLDEKQTRRWNQDYPDFIPSYVDKNEVFDMLDWITKQPVDNWIVPFSSIVDFEAKLITWIDEYDRSLPISSQSVGQSLRDSVEANIIESHSKIEQNIGEIKRKLILVEGKIDQFIVKSIIEQLNLPHNISIIDTSGGVRQLNSLKSFISSFGDAYHDIIILMDSDGRNEDEIDAISYQIKSFEDETTAKLSPMMSIPGIEAWILAGTSPEVYSSFNGEITHHKMEWIQSQMKHNFNILKALEVSDDLKRFINILSN